MAKHRDTYQMWKDEGRFDEVMAFIKDSTKKLATQKEICQKLGIHETTFMKMKKAHPDIETAIINAKLDLKDELVHALYRKAIGYDVTDEIQYIEDQGKGKPPKRKITKTKKHIAPDKFCILYLLTKHFGLEYSDRSNEIRIMESRLQISSEEWKANENEDEYSDDQD